MKKHLEEYMCEEYIRLVTILIFYVIIHFIGVVACNCVFY